MSRLCNSFELIDTSWYTERGGGVSILQVGISEHIIAGFAFPELVCLLRFFVLLRVGGAVDSIPRRAEHQQGDVKPGEEPHLSFSPEKPELGFRDSWGSQSHERTRGPRECTKRKRPEMLAGPRTRAQRIWLDQFRSVFVWGQRLLRLEIGSCFWLDFK